MTSLPDPSNVITADEVHPMTRSELREGYIRDGWADATVDQFTRLVAELRVLGTRVAGEKAVQWTFVGGVVVQMVAGEGPPLWFVRLEGRVQR